jgi:hypothetical protein
MRRCAQLTVLVCVISVPAVAFAQASIAGVVRDGSGAVLPGVTVEASSPALIEKVRSVITDGTGQYRIVDLRPGVYTVTFTLAGFTTIKREGIALEGTFVAGVNADLRVGAVEETITVTGESPIVDTQSSQTVRTLDNELIAGIPSSRQYFALTALMPGVNAQGADVGGSTGPLFSVFQAHGGRRNEGQVQVDGLSAGWQGMGVSGYVPEVGSAEEVTFTIAGGLGEAPTGGPQMNLIPRQGGNVLSGSLFGSWAGDAWQGSNLSDAQRDSGLRAIGELVKLWDVNGTLGGPIARDRLWFFVTGRHLGTRNKVAGIFINRNAGDPAKWTYDPDFNDQAVDDNTTRNMSLRLTWQASLRNKVSVWWDEQKTCQSCIGGGFSGGASGQLATGALAQEADGSNHNPIRMAQATWTSPVTTRLLLEAAFGLGPDAWFGDKERPTNNRDLINVIEAAGIVPGIEYRGQDGQRNYGYLRTYRGSLSYITGAHNLKVGGRLQHTNAAFITYYNNSRLRYNFTNGVPTQLTMYGDHAADNPFENNFTQLYAQDQWTVRRLTLQAGLRFERITSFYPEAHFGPELYIPTRLDFPAQEGGVNPRDINPRFGAAFDLFGTGRTALKASLGRYPTPTNSYEAYGRLQQPAFRVATMTNRAWTDTNGNFVPDCVLLNPAQNGECGPWTNQNFGKYVVSTTYDPKVLGGWNVREYSWDFAAGVQQQLAPRISVEATYIRRSWGNQTVTDNRAVSRADFDRFGLTAPADSRLPDGGGYRVDGIYEVRADKFGQIDNFVTHAKNFGDGRIERYNGVDVILNARLQAGLQLQGGFNVGQSTLNECDVVAEVPESLTNAAPPFIRTPESFCDRASGVLTSLSGLASYTVPKLDVQIAGTFQSRPFAGANFPGIDTQSLAANQLVFNAQVVPELGRPLAGNTQVIFVNMVEPGILYGDRINQLDFRVSKILRVGRTRTNVGVDLFNLFNANAVSQYFQTYSGNGSTWLQPTSLISARFAKLSVQFDF